MNSSGHSNKTHAARTRRRGEIFQISHLKDLGLSLLRFPALTLPLPCQMHSDLPFSAHLCREKFPRK